LKTPGILRKLGRDRRGSALLEFAFIAPLLFGLTIGVVDVGRLGLAVSTLSDSATAAARFASVHGNESAVTVSTQQVVDFTRNRIGGLPADSVNVNVTWDPDNSPGSKVTVSVVYQFGFLVDPLIPIGPLTLERSSTVTIF
jgi:Flp pilus assembly protein TadG